MTDFDAYWASLDDELSEIAARPTIDKIPLMSGEDFTVYGVRLASVGPYRIFGYLSVPTGDGPFPGILQVPRYGSVNNPPHYNDRLRYVVLTLMHRGQRLADETFFADYPGLMTHGISDPDTYVYRGIVADCLRGAEFLLAREKLDKTRVGVVGDDLAVLTAARRDGFTALRVNGRLFYRPVEAAARDHAYPTEEINDFLRADPGAKAAMERTLDLFDPVEHAATVRTADTLLCLNSEIGEGPDWLTPLADALPGQVESYELTDSDGIDADFLDTWLADRLGVPPMRKMLSPAELAER